MEVSESPPSKEAKTPSKEEESDDSNWSDINSADEAGEEDEGEKSLRIDLPDDEETESSMMTGKTGKSPTRRHSFVTFTATSGSSKKSKMHRQKKKALNRKRLGLKKIDVPEDIAKGSQELESVEKIAGKLKMNRTQVKSVLRELAETPELFNLVLQQAGESPPINMNDSGSTPDVRVTRTVAKNVAKEGGKLWLPILENESNKTPVKTNVKSKKAQKEAVPFIAADLPDEDDEEYDPSKDAAYVSDEESVASASDTGTPLSCSSTMISTPNISSSFIQTDEEEAKSPFKKPQEIAANSNVVRSLNFDEKADRLTRSKANLKEVTIEELETKFVPPDITADMYDNDYEIDVDYKLFCAETFWTPVEKEAEKETEKETEDPDYEFDQELDQEDESEFKFNRSTKISQKEADLLMQDIISAYDLDETTEEQHKQMGQNAKGRVGQNEDHSNLSQQGGQQQFYPSVFNYELTNDQRLLIGQQMRQHIQLLTQMSLLTSKDHQWQELHQDCRNMLSEVMNRSFAHQYSIYAQDNLYPSMQLLQEWDQSPMAATYKKEVSKKVKYELTDELIHFMADKPAFIYPTMLPSSALRPTLLGEENKPYFAKAEDNLIALGLEHFYGGSDKWKKSAKGLTEAYIYIASSIMHGKTVKQIRLRVKNRKDKCRKNEPNAIIYYFEHFHAPREAMNELMSYDSKNVVAPRFQDPSLLPEFWRERLMMPLKCNKQVIVTPSVTSQQIFSSVSVTLSETDTPLFTIIPQVDVAYQPILPAPSLTSTPVPNPIPKPETSKPKVNKEASKTVKKPSPPRKKPSVVRQLLPKPEVPVVQESLPSPALEEPMETEEQQQQSIVQEQPNVEVPVVSLADMPLLMTGTPVKTIDKKPTEETETPGKEVQQKSTRKSKQQKEAELNMQMLEAEKPDEEALRKQHEALEISMNAKELLTSEKFEQFCKIVVQDGISNKRKFTELHSLCSGKMTLQEMLLDLLTPGEALELGTSVYQQYCLRDAMKKFFRKVRIVFSGQASVYTKILKDFQTILANPDVKSEELVSLGQKYFKNHQQLLDEFTTFIAGVPYPESLLPEPEIVDLSDEEDEDKFDEKVNLVDGEDDLGGDNCPCGCHESPGIQHCIHCSLKFVNGRVYSRDGKTLRPVKITYPNASLTSKRAKKRRKKK